MKHPDSQPTLVFADKKGNILDFPDIDMAGASNSDYLAPALSDLIPLPEGSEIFTLPDRLPVGWDSAADEAVLLQENPYQSGETVQAVAAFMAPAHTAILGCAYQSNENPQTLPLFAYTAVGWHDGQFWVAGFRSDNECRQDANQFDYALIERKTRKKLKQFKNNRLIQHIGKCCLTYGCPAARNYFMGRWEAPLPTSPACNARCIGCISKQPSGCCPSTQDRIGFVPSPAEVAGLAIPHLETAPNPIVSFGQGCEGEPLLQADLLVAAVKKIRKSTDRGTINLNSNSSRPEQVKRLAQAGLDSIRVSINSTQERYYNRYYRPTDYSFDDVKQSIDIMKEYDRFVSLNYFILPGLTDSVEEFESFCQLIHRHRPDFIQLRNLNMDPEWYRRELGISGNTRTMGIRNWLEAVKKQFPGLGFGYFNPQVR